MTDIITMKESGLKVGNHPIIPFIEGDGTGPDIWRATVGVVDAAVEKAYNGERKIEWKEVLAGEKAYKATGQWLPQETLDADPTFAKLMEEANKYIGYPYVWGGSDPETSFDCSGFVCYVFTNSGIYNTGRLGAKGLRSLCRNVPDDQPQPGDIVFFDGTMGEGVEGVTHCGIYVGNNMMIHCGSPIGYANFNDSYWRTHFHSYGRIPH